MSDERGREAQPAAVADARAPEGAAVGARVAGGEHAADALLAGRQAPVAESGEPELPPAPPARVPVHHARNLGVRLGVALAVVALDHAVKAVVVSRLALGDEWPQGGAVTLHLVHNDGAAFSILPGAQGLFLAIAAVVAAFIVVAGDAVGSAWWKQATLGLILGGAVANAADRLVQGYVVDFVDLHHWPVFNVADSCIVVGVAAAVLGFGRSDRPRAARERHPA